jgi:hypothetical protein
MSMRIETLHVPTPNPVGVIALTIAVVVLLALSAGAGSRVAPLFCIAVPMLVLAFDTREP